MPKISTTLLPDTSYQALMRQRNALIATIPGTFQIKNSNQKRTPGSAWMKNA
jgi:hypothetical protein